MLFTLGHTYGFLSFQPDTSEGQTVYQSMKTVTLTAKGRNYTYGNFYRGFGLSITISMIFSAFLCWHLGQLAKTNPGAIGALGWVLFGAQVANAVLSFLYFGPPPMVLSAALALILGTAAWLARV